MTGLAERRMSAEIEGEFALLLIGVRINRVWKPRSWWPVVTAMPRMLAELAAQPELGLLHARTHAGFPNVLVVQYWRSHAQLQAYAQARDHAHLPAWTAFNRSVGTSGDVGIWHETFIVAPGRSESIYVDMPAYGMGRAGTLLPATGTRVSAQRRLDRAAASGLGINPAAPPASP